jgi:hypothetical protein
MVGDDDRPQDRAGDWSDDRADDPTLEPLGLVPGEAVRWRRRDKGHWQQGVVVRREPDGSVAVRDGEGAWRSILVDRLEARGPNHRGTLTWEPLADRIDRPTQLSLWRG